MKIFAIYTNIKLIKKPEWLGEFRSKYDKPYEFHVTLKQPCFIKEERTADIKQKTANLFSSLEIINHKIELVFDNLVIDPNDNGTTIMIRARNAPILMDLQKNICTMLREDKNYVKPASEKWEQNFDPHITIARNINKEQYQDAIKYLVGDYACEGIIEEVVLSIVKEDTPEEAKNPVNQTIFRL